MALVAIPTEDTQENREQLYNDCLAKFAEMEANILVLGYDKELLRLCRALFFFQFGVA
jgi:hypothetical protein